MSRVEHLEGFRGDLHAPLAAVDRRPGGRGPLVRAAGHPGARAPGMPGVHRRGHPAGSFGKDFAAVHGKGPAVVVEFAGQEFERWVVTVDDPDAVVARAAGRDGLGLSAPGPRTADRRGQAVRSSGHSPRRSGPSSRWVYVPPRCRDRQVSIDWARGRTTDGSVVVVCHVGSAARSKQSHVPSPNCT